jgi:hypothetical protein
VQRLVASAAALTSALPLRPNSRDRRAHLSDGPQPEFPDELVEVRVDSRQSIVVHEWGALGGLVQLIRPNFRHGTGDLALVVVPEAQRKLWPVEGAIVFINDVLTEFRLRKLYAEMSGISYERVGNGMLRIFQVEGVLRDHEWHDGRYWDSYLLALYRTEWQAVFEPLVQRLARGRAAPGFAS